MIGIYKITNLVNNKIYIGQSKDVEHRIKDHISGLNHNKGHNPHLQNAWNKYGENNFKFEVIHILDSEDDLDYWEIYYIDKYKSHDSNYGYNFTLGGKNAVLTERYKDNIGKSSRGKNSNFTFDDVRHIKLALYCLMDRKEIFKMFNTNRAVVTGIATGENFDYIVPELNKTINNLKQSLIDERNEYILQLYDNGLRIVDIVNETGLSTSIVEKCIYKHRDTTKKVNECKIERYYKIKELLNEGYNKYQISKILNIPATTVYRYSSKDFKLEDKLELPFKKVTKEINESIINMYFNENKSIKEISEFYNLSRNTIEFYINKYKYANTEVS